MKRALFSFLLSLILTSTVNAARSIELLTGGLTYHLTPGNDYNANRITDDGAGIANSMIGITFFEEKELLFQSVTAFGGQNSVGLPMGGFVYERGIGGVNSRWQLGIALGGYMEDDNAWRSYLVNKYQIKGEPFRIAEINGTGLVPVAGLAANYQIYSNKYCYVKVNTLISLIILNATIAFGFNL